MNILVRNMIVVTEYSKVLSIEISFVLMYNVNIMKCIRYIYDIILLYRHAVRRFVQENQGLMRRMYGDERHINVLRAEFERNDVELKYDDYYHHFSDDHR